MQISFATAASAATLALPVEKDGIDRLATSELAADALQIVVGAARASRFDGEAATIIEAFVPESDGVRRVLLVGVGGGGESDYERAGGALTARLLTSGVEVVAVDLAASGASAKAVARFAAGAAQRGWRHDLYRTKLPEKSKPTLGSIVLLNTPDGSEAAWAPMKALTEGLELTRTLVAEPPNASSIPNRSSPRGARRYRRDLGLEATVLGETEMRELGMGALLGVSAGSARDFPRLLALKWSGAGTGDPALAWPGSARA